MSEALPSRVRVVEVVRVMSALLVPAVRPHRGPQG